MHKGPTRIQWPPVCVCVCVCEMVSFTGCCSDSGLEQLRKAHKWVGPPLSQTVNTFKMAADSQRPDDEASVEWRFTSHDIESGVHFGTWFALSLLSKMCISFPQFSKTKKTNLLSFTVASFRRSLIFLKAFWGKKLFAALHLYWVSRLYSSFSSIMGLVEKEYKECSLQYYITLL